MNKLLKKVLIATTLMLLCVNAQAGNPVSKSITLNASTFTAITVSTPVWGADLGCITSDSSAWIYSEDAAGTVPITIPAPGSISFKCRKSVAGIVFYAKAASGTPELSVFVGNCRN
jgi:hypothetical protein